MIFDQYLITATDKITGKRLHGETVYLFGLFMYIFVGGLVNDPYKRTAKWGYCKVSEGLLSRTINTLKGTRS